MRRAVLRCFVLRARCVELNRGLALVYLYVGVKIWVGKGLGFILSNGRECSLECIYHLIEI